MGLATGSTTGALEVDVAPKDERVRRYGPVRVYAFLARHTGDDITLTRGDKQVGSHGASNGVYRGGEPNGGTRGLDPPRAPQQGRANLRTPRPASTGNGTCATCPTCRVRVDLPRFRHTSSESRYWLAAERVRFARLTESNDRLVRPEILGRADVRSRQEEVLVERESEGPPEHVTRAGQSHLSAKSSTGYDAQPCTGSAGPRTRAASSAKNRPQPGPSRPVAGGLHARRGRRTLRCPSAALRDLRAVAQVAAHARFG